MENKMTIKDALKMMYQELSQVSVPAEYTFTIGVHVGRTLLIVKDCLDSIESEEQMKAAEESKEELPVIDDVEFEEKEGETDA